MIRYHEAHGHLPSRGRTRGGHRTVDEQDVRWLQNLQTPLTAGVTPATALRALHGQLSGSERAAIDRLSGNVPQIRQQLDSTVDAEKVPPEERTSLAFDVFVMRTRIEACISDGLCEAGLFQATSPCSACLQSRASSPAPYWPASSA
ncbi:MAG TPA: hypothetical protein VI094_21780 [Propionibacteriaceae bacterium]